MKPVRIILIGVVVFLTLHVLSNSVARERPVKVVAAEMTK
jgi:hypothetical protein